MATVKLYSDITHEFVQLNGCLICILSSYGPLRKLIKLLNLKTDLLDWKAISTRQRQHTKEARAKIFSQEHSIVPQWRTDKIQIKLDDIGFSYNEKAIVLKGVTASVAQGSMIAVVGKHGEGKATLLRLMGQSAFPTEGFLFMPSHLRPLYVCQELTLMDTTALGNLTFGSPDESPSRVLSILEALGMHQTIAVVRDEMAEMSLSTDVGGKGKNLTNLPKAAHFFQPTNWRASSLPYNERAKMCLARALIMNPEVLVLQRPLSHFHDTVRDAVMAVITEHCRQRGFGMPHEDWEYRRPRTVVFTAATYNELTLADCIWEVRGAQGVRQIPSAAHFTIDDLKRLDIKPP